MLPLFLQRLLDVNSKQLTADEQLPLVLDSPHTALPMYLKIVIEVSRWMALQWGHNGCDGVSNHRSLCCILNRLFRRRSKKTSKLRVTGLCEGNSPVTGEFPAQRASNAENVSVLWRHHGTRSNRNEHCLLCNYIHYTMANSYNKTKPQLQKSSRNVRFKTSLLSQLAITKYLYSLTFWGLNEMASILKMTFTIIFLIRAFLHFC